LLIGETLETFNRTASPSGESMREIIAEKLRLLGALQ
jgi:hypothetical protein